MHTIGAFKSMKRVYVKNSVMASLVQQNKTKKNGRVKLEMLTQEPKLD